MTLALEAILWNTGAGRLCNPCPLHDIHTTIIPYKWSYWRALNLAIWLQTGSSKILVEFKFGGGPNLACNDGT